MYIKHVHIENFKRYKGSFDLDLNDHLNILVGDNEAGKSTIVEAIYLALTGVYNGHYLRNELSQYIFNQEVVKEYQDSVRNGNGGEPPRVLIELFFEGEKITSFEGDENYTKTGAMGIRYVVFFDETLVGTEYQELLSKSTNTLPLEFYNISWSFFSRDLVSSSRQIPFKASIIDSSNGRIINGSDIYFNNILRENLDKKDEIDISMAYRSLKDKFMIDESIDTINKKVKESSKISNKNVKLSVDLSSRNSWESILMTYIDDVPFPYIGKGEQSIIKTKIALSNKKTTNANIVLVEEPENHLSHSKLNELLYYISNECVEKQLLITTHSSFVLNKLGLDSLILLNGKTSIKLTNLAKETSDYFKKLPGYNTLRMLLAKKTILVEGPSDELIVQRAYWDNNNKLPIEDGIDVITVGNLSFLRFLEIAKVLELNVSVVTDNDGDYDAIKRKYKNYLVEGSTIKICCDEKVDTEPQKIDGKDYNCNTLEPKLLKENSKKIFSKIINKEFSSDEELLIYLKTNKTDFALAVFESSEKIKYPKYILDSFS